MSIIPENGFFFDQESVARLPDAGTHKEVNQFPCSISKPGMEIKYSTNGNSWSAPTESSNCTLLFAILKLQEDLYEGRKFVNNNGGMDEIELVSSQAGKIGPMDLYRIEKVRREEWTVEDARAHKACVYEERVTITQEQKKEIPKAESGKLTLTGMWDWIEKNS